ncbi:MAG: bifunctional glutamate N-acetyltransferase/amino-acid acetyltransferase ArgJ [Betaproteobacteria bacterium]|jgi:glutamate N-acetyltransferase/amino-acid N-acetyltransferase|nr:bifunctional glutamate N-acetyltransferase/amino-acid acetyltransferase ArgJ [Betaproteobacteria bacterium]
MAVNLAPPDPAALEPIAGVALGVTMAGIRKVGRRDLLVMRLAPGSTIAGVFTKNRFCAAPVTLALRHLAAGWEARGLVVNTGNANAGTGEDGIARARAVCEGLARALGCAVEQILPFSTGVIMEPLPVERILDGLPAAVADLREANWAQAAEAIMTTDTVPKAASQRAVLSGGEVRVTGIAKGAGMIRPDMATMLAFVATDAVVARADLESLLRNAAERSFNAITVDGDMSTNDAFMLVASGGAGVAARDAADLARLGETIDAVAIRLAQGIVRDAEGATKFVTLRIEGGRDEDECRRIAYAIAHSPLVKTAFFASDPNLGRILAAIGYAGVADLDAGRVDLYLDGLRVARGGARDPEYNEDQAVAAMGKPEFELRVALNRGAAAATLWTCDLSFDYVKINAEYRT